MLKVAVVAWLTAGAVQAQTPVIAMLGDSLTQGFGLQVDDGLVPALQRWLDARGADVRLINAGVSGDTTAGGAARVGWTLTPEVKGLVVALGANDMLRGLPPEAARENLATILRSAEDKGIVSLLVGFPAPPNYGADYQSSFNAAYTELAAEFDTVFLDNLLAPLQTAEGPLTQYLQADLLHPNPEGVALIVEHLGPAVVTLLERMER